MTQMDKNKQTKVPKGKYQRVISGKFWASFDQVCSKWSKMAKNGQNGKTGQIWTKNDQKCQICKVQNRGLQMSSSIRL